MVHGKSRYVEDLEVKITMKKKLQCMTFLCCLVSILLCACGKRETLFQATVIEAADDSLLVKPVDGSSELNSADEFFVPNKEQLELQTGDLVEISYNGDILESYPAQLGEVYKITLIDQAE